MLREEDGPTKFCTDSDSPCDAEALLPGSGAWVLVELPEDGPSMGACNSAMVAAYDIWSNVSISQSIEKYVTGMAHRLSLWLGVPFTH